MTDNSLSKSEISVIHECLKAAAYGPFFVNEEENDPYSEIHTIFGLYIDELKGIADSKPDIFDQSKFVRLAINNSLNNLINFPHRCSGEVWTQYISVSENELITIFKKWKSLAYREGKPSSD